MIKWNGRTEPRGLAHIGNTALLDRIVTDHQAEQAARRNRSEWVILDADGKCEACGQPLFEGGVALHFPAHEALVCRGCGEDPDRPRVVQVDIDEWERQMCPPGFRG